MVFVEFPFQFVGPVLFCFFFFQWNFFLNWCFFVIKSFPIFLKKWVLFLERGMMEILRLCLVPGKFEGKYQGKDIGRKSKKKERKKKKINKFKVNKLFLYTFLN